MTELVGKVRRKLRQLREFANVRGVVYFAQRRVLAPKARDRVARFVARFLPRPASAGRRRARAPPRFG